MTLNRPLAVSALQPAGAVAEWAAPAASAAAEGFYCTGTAKPPEDCSVSPNTQNIRLTENAFILFTYCKDSAMQKQIVWILK